MHQSQLLSIVDKELVKFAQYFSANYKTLNTGDYVSESGQYKISYVEKIEHHGRTIFSVARTSNKDGRIEIDRSQITRKEYTSNYLFYLIVWCRLKFICVWARSETSKKIGMEYNSDCSDISTDRDAIRFYLLKGLSKRDLAVGFIENMKKSPTAENKQRIIQMRKMLGRTRLHDFIDSIRLFFKR